MKNKVTSFRDLIVWQKSHMLVLDIYKSTSSFPSIEQFALSTQLRRAAVSITSNIAEGFYRRTATDKNSFYITALGSVGEVVNQLIISCDLGYISKADFAKFEMRLNEIVKMLRAMMRTSVTK